MKIHEYQAKQILAKFGVQIPRGDVADSPVKVREIAETVGCPVVLKAQIHAGGRGKGGGIKVAKSPEEAEGLAHEAAELCGVPEARIYICPYHAKARGPKVVWKYAKDHECRKPKPGMLLEAMEDAGVSADETIFVGDFETDEQAAENAGVRFYWAEVFFGG